MAELHVQPKRNNNWWIWLLLAIIAIALIIFLARGCNNEENRATTGDTTASDTSTAGNTAATTPNTKGNDTWGDVDFNSPRANYDEITDKGISVRGNNKYAIYSLGENVLFDVDKSTIRKDGESKLKQIAASLNKRYKDGDIRIYGRTDSTGDAGDNKQLAEDRAEAVRTWIMKNGNFSEDHISLHPLGESQPVASNATEQGRQQNRSVEIVARQR